MVTEWYQQGWWPLVGAVVVLALTNGFALWSIYLQAQRNLASQLKLKQIEFISQQLAEFYNPLYALLVTNLGVFLAVGPPSFPDDAIHRDAAGKVWSSVKEEVILPNNQSIQ